MPTNSPYSLATSPLGLLDPTASLLTTPTTPPHPLGYTRNSPSTLLRPDLPPLSLLLLADKLADLYEMVFPDNPEWLDEEVVAWKDEQDVGSAVERFLGRVSNLFPVQDDFWDTDLEVIEWRLWEIPIITMGYDIYYDEWIDLKEPAAYLLHMCHSRPDEDSPARRDDFAGLYPDHQVPRSLEPDCLVETLRQVIAEEGETLPLEALPDLIEKLDQNTGNVWLDVGEITLAESGYPEWSREEVEWLAAEWQKAKPVLEGVNRLLDWLNETPEEVYDKLTAVRDALLTAYNRVQEKTEPPAPEATT